MTKTKKKAGPRIPALRVHKRSRRCYATFNGQVVCFGKVDDAETRVRYTNHLAKWEARGRKPEEPRDEGLTRYE